MASTHRRVWMLWVWVFWSVLAGSAAAESKRPNIVFCFADDWGRYLGAHASLESRPTPNRVVKTPHLDALAARGVLFKNAFVNAPSCTPCRSSLLSGQYFYRTGRGAILSGAQWDSSIPTWPLLLKDAGYIIGKTGKVWSPGTPADAPYGGQQFAYQSSGMRFNNFSEEVTKAMSSGTSLEAARDALFAEVDGNFESFLKARSSDAPFCYWFGPTTVHRTWVKGSGKALWGIDPEDLKGKLPAFLPDVPEVRQDFADYLGEIQAFDAYVGRLVAILAAKGELENTLIVVSGDHGAPGFPYGKCNLYDFGVGVALVVAGPNIPGGRVVDDYVSLPDLAPTLLEFGGVKIPAGMTARSLKPVLESSMSGQVDPQRTWVLTGRERHVDDAREGNLPYPQRALRTQDYLYIRNFQPDRWPLGAPLAVTDTSAPDAGLLEQNTRLAYPDMDAGPTKAWLIEHRHDPQWKPYVDYAFAKRPAEELYDLRTDPDQIRNLAGQADHAEAQANLSRHLLTILTRTGDPRVTGTGDTFDRPPFVDPEPKATGQGKAKKKKAAGSGS